MKFSVKESIKEIVDVEICLCFLGLEGEGAILGRQPTGFL
jgi:hypothetical protein